MQPAGSRVLVVQHEQQVPLRLLGDWLDQAGAVVTVVCPDEGEPLPHHRGLAAYDALVVLGGTMDSWDDAGHPWFPAVRDLIVAAGRQQMPTLAVCLGHQLATQAYGGAVGRNPAGPTLGVVPVGWHDAARDDLLLGGIAAAPTGSATPAVHHNSDIATALPATATVLASAPDGSPQAVRFTPTVWGVQFHPEADAALVAAWESHAGRDSADDSTALVAQVAAAEPDLVAAWRPLADRLLTLAGARAGAGAGVAATS